MRPSNHRRPAPRRTIQASALTLGAALLLVIGSGPVDAAPIAVLNPEGTAHGYLALLGENGEPIAQGELLQTVKRGRVESRLIFRFKDGSLYDEKTTFSQHRVFAVHKYRLTERGPSFPEELHITMDRESSRYRVRSRAAPGQPEKVTAGRLELPADVYNGLIGTVIKNLAPGKSETVKFVAFTPEPKVVPLELHPEAEEPVRVGRTLKTATRWTLKPQLGDVVRFFGKILGKLPEEFHYRFWILHDVIPAFARFEGPLYLMGPVWRIELLSPRLEESLTARAVD